MKKLISILLVLALCMTLTAFGEEASEPGILSAEQIRNAINGFRATATDLPLIASDLSEDAESGDSRILQYSFGNIHANTPELTEDTVIYDITVLTDEWEVLPGIAVNGFTEDILNSFRNDNAGLAGDYNGALIYLEGDPAKGFNGALLSRDGQKNTQLHYLSVVPNGNMFDIAGVIFFIDSNCINAIELYAADGTLSPEDAAGQYSLLSVYADEDDYVSVPTDYNNGTTLDPFQTDDLVFSGIDFLNADSSAFPNRLDEMYIDNGDGTYLHRVDGEGYNVIFAADKDGNDLCIDTLTVTGENLEGPRCVRVGDIMIDDQVRFRYEDTEFDYDNMIQMMYGSRNVAPYGIAEYHTDGTAELTYTVPVEDGMTVMLRLEYSSDGMVLTTFTVKIL